MPPLRGRVRETPTHSFPRPPQAYRDEAPLGHAALPPVNIPRLMNRLRANFSSNPDEPKPPHPLADFLKTLDTSILPQSMVPPRPKPPMPTDFMVHPERSWRSMSKDAVRRHIMQRCNARRRYIAAYAIWEQQHNKWAFGVYHLMRSIIKFQQRATQATGAEKAGGEVEMEDAEDAATVLDETEAFSLAATEFDSAVLRDLDPDGTALTTLQPGAQADELERANRFFISQYKRNLQQPQNPLLPALQRQGPKGSFGLSAEGSQPRLRRTPSVELPESAARKLQPATIPFVPGPIVFDQEAQREASVHSEGETEEEWSLPSSVNLFSGKCACGYEGCHCAVWDWWWDKTMDMLAYAEYVDVGLPGNPPYFGPRIARFHFVQEPSPPLVIDPTCRSLPAPPVDRPARTGWPYHHVAIHMKPPFPRPSFLTMEAHFSRQARVERWREQVDKDQPEEAVLDPNLPAQGEKSRRKAVVEPTTTAEDQFPVQGFDPNIGDNNATPQRYTLPVPRTSHGQQTSQRSDYSVIKLEWEGFLEKDPKVTTEYSQAIINTILNELEVTMIPRASITNYKNPWRSRNRLVQWMAHMHYSCDLPPEIFFLGIHLLDQYASLQRSHGPLFGTGYDIIALACLWSAWKYEDSSPSVVPLDALLAYATSRAITRERVISTEWTVHQTVKHNLAYVGPLVAMRLDLMACECTREMAYIARFLLDISSTIDMLATFRPSSWGPVCVRLASELMGVPAKVNTVSGELMFNPLQDCQDPEAAPSLVINKRVPEQWARYIIVAVMTMPSPLKSPDHALFHKWTQPIVNNVAGWCRAAFRKAWPEDCQIEPTRDLLKLRQLVQTGEIPRFKLGAGPPRGHPLFET